MEWTKVEKRENALIQVANGNECSKNGQFADAELCFRKALDQDPALSIAYNGLGWALQKQGDTNGAIDFYQKALTLDPFLKIAQVNLAFLFSELGRFSEAIPVLRKLVNANRKDIKLLKKLIDAYVQFGDEANASLYYEVYSILLKGSRWYNLQKLGVPVQDVLVPKPFLTNGQLKHDIEQFRYLKEQGILENDIPEMTKRYECVLSERISIGDTERRELNDREHGLIGPVYGRIVHKTNTPRVKQVFSKTWNGVLAEDDYLAHPLGLVVIDNFLSEEALYSVRQFCLESTVWFENHYGYDRLGAFFRHGFNCPLLIQISEEIRNAFPRVIGDRHHLQNLWAFKFGIKESAISAHADFAAVNVNFWITPDEANLDKNTGGMVIYDVEAPIDWDFDSYNRQADKIRTFLKEKQSRQINIPYKANRAIIFNSDLFHATQPLHFKEGYENKRINITFLYGKRETVHGQKA